jgi:hypothetical protein
MPRSARLAHLKLYHLDCQCQRCRDDLDVYQVCRASPLLPLNRFSLVPGFHELRAPPLNQEHYVKLTKGQIEQVYEACQQLSSNGLERLRNRWRLCRQLVQAKSWAIEPLAQTIVETAIMLHSERAKFAEALCLACFAVSLIDPYKFVAPFKPWRVKGMLMVARLLALTAPLAASGELAREATYPALAGVLMQCDQVSICEAILLMVLRWGPLGHSNDWSVVQMAKAMMADIQSLPGREKQMSLLRAWAAESGSQEGRAFFYSEVLRPIQQIVAFAPDILEAELREP